MIKHDEDYLKMRMRAVAPSCLAHEPQASILAKHYAEHLTRWRSVADGELPEDGQVVDIIWRGMRFADLTFRKHNDGCYFDSDDNGPGYTLELATHWKSIELPEIE